MNGRVWLAALAAAAIFAPGASGAGDDGYSLSARALVGGENTELVLEVTGSPVHVFDKVQIKAWPLGGGEVQTRNLFDQPAPNGVATIPLDRLERHQRVEVHAHVKDGPQRNLEAETTVLLRPDLTVATLVAPTSVVRTRAFDVVATIEERNGDVGASAVVTLSDGVRIVATEEVTIGAGGRATVAFQGIALVEPGDHLLSVGIAESAPAEWDVAPSSAQHAIEVERYHANGVVATDHPLATELAAEVLRNGGNAIDAAAVAQFVLNVVQPQLSGIGGGSNVLVRLSSGAVHAIDARETAPAATTPSMYSGRTAAAVGPNGYSVGVPGTLLAVERMLDEWGTMSLADTLEPAIALAENGFSAGHYLALTSADARAAVQPETKALFRRSDGTKLVEGDRVVQRDLAKTFRLIAEHGSSVFYRGEIAAAIVEAQRRSVFAGGSGRMMLADLAAYDIDVESPLGIDYEGYRVVGAPPSTNGGIVVLETLGLLREFKAANRDYEMPFGSRNSLHVFLEAMRLAFADRDKWIGDDRFTDVPAEELLAQPYLEERARLIGRETVMPGMPAAGDPEDDPIGHTTHFSIIDRWGNAVVMTSTIADAFGSGITVPGYGFLLNDSLTLFNLTPRANAVTGDPGANDPAGGKRPMGSMAPTLVMKDGEPVAATGSYGGGFIPSIVLNVVRNLADYAMPLQQAVDAPRLWSAFRSGDAAVNPGFAAAIQPLRDMGHVAPHAGNVARNPSGGLAIGSTASFGVDLATFGLVGAADRTRFPDARTVVVERS